MFAILGESPSFVTIAVFPIVIDEIFQGRAKVIVVFFDGRIEEYEVSMQMIFEWEAMLKNG